MYANIFVYIGLFVNIYWDCYENMQVPNCQKCTRTFKSLKKTGFPEFGSILKLKIKMSLH